MSREYVYESVEVSGASTGTDDNAVRVAVARASQALRHSGRSPVAAIRGLVEKGRVARFQVTIKLRSAGRS